MTISSTTRKAGPFAGNGVATTFPFGFKVFANSDLALTLTSASGATSALVLDSDYSVALNADQDASPGGTITYPRVGSGGLLLPTGSSLIAIGDTPYDQPTDLTNEGGFYPSTIEDMSDRSTIQIQQLEELASRTLHFPVTEDATAGEFAPASDRADTVFGFDTIGGPTYLPIPASVGAGDLKSESWTAGTDYVQNTTTVVTLSRAYGSAANIGTVVMDGVAQDPNTYALISGGTQLQFNAPIPASRVWCIGGTTLSLYVPPNGTVGDAQLSWGGILNRVCDSVAALASLTISTYTRAFVTGYYAAGDGGGGSYYYSASTAHASANGGTVIASTTGPGCWLLAHARAVSVKQFGAKGDGATDDSTAFQNALTALQTAGGGTLYLPASTYVLATALTYVAPNTTAGLSIAGDGSSVTVLKFRGSVNGLSVALNGPFTAVQMCGFSVTTNTVNTQNAITISQSVAVPDPANVAANKLSDILIYGEGGYGSGHLNCWLNGVVVAGASNINFDTVYIFGGASAPYPNTDGAGFNLSGTGTKIPVVFNFVNCVVNLMGSGILYGSWVQGVQVTNCNFTGCFYGIYAPASAVNLVQLCVSNSQFNCQGGILAGAPIQGLIIANNFFLFPNNSSCIQLEQTSLTNIYGNTFEPASFPATNSNGVVIQNTVTSGISATITGNSFVNVPSACIDLDTTSSACRVSNNTFYGTSIFKVQDNGTGNGVEMRLNANPGYAVTTDRAVEQWGSTTVTLNSAGGGAMSFPLAMAALHTALVSNGNIGASPNTDVVANMASSNGTTLTFQVYPNPGAGNYQLNWLVRGSL